MTKLADLKKRLMNNPEFQRECEKTDAELLDQLAIGVSGETLDELGSSLNAPGVARDRLVKLFGSE